MLTSYLSQTNSLLQNPVPANPLYSTADLTRYINEGRQQLAMDAECIRALTSGPTVMNIRDYAFSIFATFTTGGSIITGISKALTVTQMAVQSGGALLPMTERNYNWFYRYYIASGAAAATGIPRIWSQQGRGSSGSFSVSPIPTIAGTVFAEVTCLPVDLVDDTTAEAIPAPFTTAIQFYAAYRAYLSSQKTNDAKTMFDRYEQYVQRAIQQNTPTMLPILHPGGLGARGAASRAPVTGPLQGGGGGGQG